MASSAGLIPEKSIDSPKAASPRSTVSLRSTISIASASLFDVVSSSTSSVSSITSSKSMVSPISLAATSSSSSSTSVSSAELASANASTFNVGNSSNSLLKAPGGFSSTTWSTSGISSLITGIGSFARLVIVTTSLLSNSSRDALMASGIPFKFWPAAMASTISSRAVWALFRVSQIAGEQCNWSAMIAS